MLTRTVRLFEVRRTSVRSVGAPAPERYQLCPPWAVRHIYCGSHAPTVVRDYANPYGRSPCTMARQLLMYIYACAFQNTTAHASACTSTRTRTLTCTHSNSFYDRWPGQRGSCSYAAWTRGFLDIVHITFASAHSRHVNMCMCTHTHSMVDADDFNAHAYQKKQATHTVRMIWRNNAPILVRATGAYAQDRVRAFGTCAISNGRK